MKKCRMQVDMEGIFVFLLVKWSVHFALNDFPTAQITVVLEQQWACF
jgi:hypothetical protein